MRYALSFVLFVLLSGCGPFTKTQDRPPCPVCKAQAVRTFWKTRKESKYIKHRVVEYYCGSLGYTNNYMLINGYIKCSKEDR
jgi:hypothetical protein